METLLQHMAEKKLDKPNSKYLEFKMDFDVTTLVVVSSLN